MLAVGCLGFFGTLESCVILMACWLRSYCAID